MSMSLDELKGEETTQKDNNVEVETKGTIVETASGQKVTTFSPDEIGAPKREENSLAKNLADQLNVLDKGIKENKERLYNQYTVPQMEEAAAAELLDEESEVEKSDGKIDLNDDSDTEDFDIEEDSEAVSTGTEQETTHTMEDYKVSDSIKVNNPEIKETMETNIESLKKDLGRDFFDDVDEDDSVLESDDSSDTDEELEQVKSEIKANIKPINNVIDLSKFTISKKPASSAALLQSIESVVNTSDWVLFAAKKAITMTSLNGAELDHFNPRNLSNSRNRINTYKQLYSIMYKHIQDENKPVTLEAWTKTIPFYDIDHLYFAVYRACYSKNNIVPYTCPKCGKTSMIHVDIEKMVKFDSPEIEEEFKKIYNKDSTSADTYKAELIQISDKFAAAVKLPTVFSVIFENAALDEKFLDKYADMLGLITYIDALYYINEETCQLEEVRVKTEPNDFVKTTKRKIATYAKILCSLNSDQYNNFVAKMQDLMNSNDGISYIQPTVTCSHCEEEIPEQPIEPLDMVFTRHQLGAISNL